MPATPPTIIVAHGAFHQPAHYIMFAAALDEVGLTEYRIPQLASASSSPPDDAFLQDVAILNKTIRSSLNSGRDVLIVAHSYGGMPLSDALIDFHKAGKRDAKVLGVVFVAAMVPEEGEALGNAMESGVARWVNIVGNVCTPEDPANVFFNTSNDEETQARAVGLIQPQALSSFMTPAKTASWSRYPCAYVKCKQDNSTSLADQDHMIAKLKRRCEWQPTVAEIDSDHVPFLCAPERLAKMLQTLVSDAE